MQGIFKKKKRTLSVLSILISAIVVLCVVFFITMCGSGPQRSISVIINEPWEVVAGYIDAYIQSQYVATDDGEAGFLYTAALYKSRVDTNSDGTVCGVNDDMANRPVLVDNLMTWTNLIPGTSLRNQWNGTTDTGGLHTTNLTELRNKVIAHREAGFSTDIAVY